MKRNIVMQSDFGIDNYLVSSMHGICKRVSQDLEIFDITHIIPPFDIKKASKILSSIIPCWPEGTVFVSVVDPGVGTSRKASVALLKNGYYVVSPDNGAFTDLDNMYGIEEIREIDEETNRYKNIEEVNIFHGRDLFSYCAAKLAANEITFEEVGPKYDLSEIVKFESYPYSITQNKVEGIAVGSKEYNFGIMDTNIPNKEFVKSNIKFGDDVKISFIYDEKSECEIKTKFVRTFGEVPIGQPLVYNEVALFIGIAINQGNFAKTNHLVDDRIYNLVIEKI